MIPKNNNFTLTIQNPCVEYLQYLKKANCGCFFLQKDIAIQDYKYGRLKMIKKNNDSKSRLYIEFCQKNEYLHVFKLKIEERGVLRKFFKTTYNFFN